MKRILITLTLFFSMLAVAFAQAPQKFTYQAVVRNESNTLVRGNVGVRITILQGGANGTMVYQETHTAVTNANGLMTLQIGGGIVMNGDFASIDWADGPYFLKTETDPTGGTNYTIEGTQQLLSVPYALYAGHAANSFSGSYNDLTDQPDIPQIPENVSAFNNDAGYITMDSIPEIPTVPTNVSAFTNDAGYITMDSVPSIPTNVSYFTNDAGYVTESTLTTENYITQNDLITNNYVTEADIPTNVSAFNNDAGYITMDSIPEIPTVPTNVSAFVNDAGYVTQSTLTTENYITQNDLITNNYVTEADIPTNVSAFTNDAGYITMDSIPAIPTVPTNVSAFVNDAGYVTQSTLTTENYITQNDLITNNYVTEADIPTNVSAFNNDAGYITMDLVPAIPTNVSAFVNDAGYVTESTLTTENYITQNDLITNNYVTEADIPTNVSAFNNDAGYITMDSIPAIPIVPTNVSAFTNDAGYITESTLANNNYITQNDLITNNYVTEADIPTNVSAFNNDAGYITMDSIPAIPTVPTNVSAFVNDAGYLTTATVQEAANIPTNVSAFTNDAGYITMDSIPAFPTVPTNVSAFVNDAGYITESTLTNNNYITQNDLITNNYVTETDIPTNVSAFINDAGYITMDSVPTIPTNVSVFVNDAGYITESTLTNNNYITQNDLITNNYVTEADIPTNVSAFNNDAGYITMDSIPVIPTVPTNVSAFVNDAGYLTTATVQEAANIPTNVSAFTNDAGYITMDSIPAIPTVPTNVSAFTNDAGYITESTLTNNNYITQNDLITNNYATTADIPTNVSAFNNDAGYITMDSIPAIPTVPTNVSAFTNDAGYITESTLTNNNYITQNDLITNNYATTADIPTNVSAFNNDAGYITMDSIPAIPTVPTNVSAFTNDAGYITESTLTTNNYITQNDLITNNYATTADIPTNVSAFNNDAGYLTSFTEQQILSISNDTIYLTGGSFVKLPAGFSGSYNDLTDVPALFSGDYNDLTNTPEIPTVPTNVSAFTNDAHYITEVDLQSLLGDLTQTLDSLQQAVEDLEVGSGEAHLPRVITKSIGSITKTTAICGGEVRNDGNDEVIARGVCWSTNPNPTIADAHTTDGAGLGFYSGRIQGLVLGATYYVRAYATNYVGTAYGNQLSFTTSRWECGTGTAVDYDGNVYNTVQIGSQCWMKENLRTIHYVDGSSIPQQNSGTDLTVACWGYPASDANNKSTYGLLYNYAAATHEGICPTGWHLPGTEWSQLINYVRSQSQYQCNSSSSNIAKALASTTGWNIGGADCAVGNTPSSNNSTGFAAMPAGGWSHVNGGTYNSFGTDALFWISGSYCILNYNSAGVNTSAANSTTMKYGCSVRCVKDDEEEEPCEPTFSTHNAEITTDQLPYVFGDTTFQAGTATGTYILLRTNAAGCDSTITLNLTVTAPVFTCGTSTLTDRDGNTYSTVLIGTQCWMASNLRTTKYADGTSISQGSNYASHDVAGWYYPQSSSSNTYRGLLYNWPAVMHGAASSSANPSGVQGICPTGWHVPSDAEWKQLEMAVGMSQSNADNTGYRGTIAAKLAGSGWKNSVVSNAPGNTNAPGHGSSGFNANGAGYFYGFSSSPGNYSEANYNGLFWSTTEYCTNASWIRKLAYDNAGVDRSWTDTWNGCSVRCLKD